MYSIQNGLLLWSVIGDYDYGVCGDCNAFEVGLVTVVLVYMGHIQVPNLGANW